MSETAPPTTTLYRVENPSLPPNPAANGVTSHPDLVGQWFTPNLDTATNYLRKSTQTHTGPTEGAQLVLAQVPTEQLPDMHVSRHPVASKMDVEGDNYLLSRDGSTPMQTLPLDEVLGDLKGQLGKFDKLQEAKHRVELAVGQMALTGQGE